MNGPNRSVSPRRRSSSHVPPKNQCTVSPGPSAKRFITYQPRLQISHEVRGSTSVSCLEYKTSWFHREPNVGNPHFISDDESNPSFTDSYIEGVFHHEFSSVLKRSFPAFLNSDTWEAVNEPTFTYGNGGVYAIRTGEASLALNPELYPSGFLTQYSQASVEEDINVFAQNLFSGEKSFWEIVERNPKIRRKAQLLIAFYQKIDPRFTESYFRRISRANPPKIMAGNRY